MKQKPNDTELREALLQITEQMARARALPSEPVHSLDALLRMRTVRELQQLAREAGISYSNLRKAELIRHLACQMGTPEHLRQLLSGLLRDEWAFFQAVAARDYMIYNQAQPMEYVRLEELCLVQSFCPEDKIIFVVPEEIQKAFRTLLAEDLDETMEMQFDLYDLAAAAVALYGLVSFRELVELIHFYLPDSACADLSEDEVFNHLLPYLVTEERFCMVLGRLAHPLLSSNRPYAEEILSVREGLPMYLPDPEVLERYTHDYEFEETPESWRLEQFLADVMEQSHLAEDHVFRVHFLCRLEPEPEELLTLLIEEIPLDLIPAQKNRLRMLLSDMIRTARPWACFGHTETDAEQLRNPGATVLPFPGTKVKTGRNDPCPCGSGKKYKNCCGKS